MVITRRPISERAPGWIARLVSAGARVLLTGVLPHSGDLTGTTKILARGRFTGVALEMDASNRILTTLPMVPVP